MQMAWTDFTICNTQPLTVLEGNNNPKPKCKISRPLENRFRISLVEYFQRKKHLFLTLYQHILDHQIGVIALQFLKTRRMLNIRTNTQFLILITTKLFLDIKHLNHIDKT